MEPEKFILWNTRFGGWRTRSGTYTSDRKQAEQLEFDEAMELCQTHRNNGQEFGLLPVSEAVLAQVPR